MLKPEDLKTAKRSILLSNIPGDLANMLLERAQMRSFDRGATIFLQGEPANHVHIVLDGWVKLYRISQNGAEAVVAVFTEGGSFGEAVALRGDVYPVTSEAVTDCRLAQVQASILLETMRTRPELCQAMLASTFQHLQGLIAQIEQLKAHNGAQRVAEFLLDLCKTDSGPSNVTLPYDKNLIAARLGMKPASLSRAFARLRDMGVTISQNHAKIQSIDELAQFVEEDRAAAWLRSE